MGHRNACNDVVDDYRASPAESLQDDRIDLGEALFVQLEENFGEHAISATEVAVHRGNRAASDSCNVGDSQSEDSAIQHFLASSLDDSTSNLQLEVGVKCAYRHVPRVVCPLMRRLLPMIATISFVGFAGCSATTNDAGNDTTIAETSDTPAATTSAVPSAPATEPAGNALVPPGFESITTADGRIRSYQIVDLSDGEPAPLLFVLHGFGGTAAMMSESSEIDQTFADRYDLHPVVVYPNGTGAEDGLPQSWNAGNCCPFSTFDLVDDVAFFDQLITELTARYDIDPERVWVVGHSNGGMMAYRLACELSSRVTAIGVAAGALMIDSCSPTRPVVALHLHGELDTVVPLAGGEIAGIVFPSAQDSTDAFSRSGNGSVELVTRATWTHDWQPEWTALFAEFLATQ